MSLTDYIYTFISVLISHIFIICVYNEFNKKNKIKILTIKNIITILFFIVLSMINNIYNLSMFRCIVFVMIWYVQNLIIFKEEFKTCMFKTLFIYSFHVLFELLFSIIVIKLPFLNYQELFKHKLICTAFTLFNVVFTYIIFKIILKNKAIRKKLHKKNIKNMLMILFSCFIIFLNNKNIIQFNIEDYFIDLLLAGILIFITGIVLYQKAKIKDQHIKNKIFLEFLETYEKKADIDSEFKHQILNNLLIIKSVKNIREARDIIDDILIKYDTKKANNLKNISKLPSGIKGIIYYKVFEIENINAEIELNISPKIDKFFNDKNSKEYKDISEIITILLDNSIESIKKQKRKSIIINIYIDKSKLIIEINNSINSSVEINKINNLGYSTKGKNRGFGLYIVKKLVDSNKNFELKQYILDQRFYSELIINK